MAQQWYYEKDGTKHGPVTSQQLKQLADSGELLRTDLVWTQGRDEWKPASTVKGLFVEPSQTEPPPVPRAVARSEPSTTGELTVFASRLPPWVYSWPAALLSLTCCFPVGLGIVWTHPRWTMVHKSVWSGGWFVVMLIGMMASPDDNKNQPKIGISNSNQVTSLDPTGALTADFYPHLLGSQREMTDWISLPGGVSMNNASLVTHRANGAIEIRPLSTEGISDSGVTTLPTMGSLKQKHYRLKDGFIELGNENESFGIVWSPILKIGATPGDRWERTLQGGMREQYELKAIKVFDDISPKLVSDRKLLCAVIERKIEVKGQIGSPLYTEFVLGHGFGPVRQFVWEVENGERKDIRASAMTSFSK